MPSAILLAEKASVGELDLVFYAVQAIELAAGATKMLLMGRNASDGFELSGRRFRRSTVVMCLLLFGTGMPECTS